MVVMVSYNYVVQDIIDWENAKIKIVNIDVLILMIRVIFLSANKE